MLYVINILYYLIADLDLLLVISCYSKLCYGVKIVLSQDEYLLPTTSKPLIYLCFLRSYNYTQTMQSVLIGSEYPVMDTLLFYFPQNSYCKAFRGVAECCAFSCFRDHVGRPDLPAIRSASRGPKQAVPRSAQSAAAGYGCDDYFFSCSLRSCSSSWRLVRRRS